MQLYVEQSGLLGTAHELGFNVHMFGAVPPIPPRPRVPGEMESRADVVDDLLRAGTPATWELAAWLRAHGDPPPPVHHDLAVVLREAPEVVISWLELSKARRGNGS